MESENFYEAFGARLFSARNEQGFSQAALAQRVGLSRASIANIEAGRQRVLLHQLYEFADALALPSVHALLLGDRRRPRSSGASSANLGKMTGSDLNLEEISDVAKIVHMFEEAGGGADNGS